MTDKNLKQLPPRRDAGFFENLTSRIKLIGRLLADRRVNPLLKLLPVGSLLYLFIPDLAPGPLDDGLIIWLGMYLFVELCPQDVVQEHTRALDSVIDAEWREVESPDDPEDKPPDLLP
jgi:hypothetical protein